MQEGLFQGHAECIKCDSSDGMAVYKKEDDEGNDYQDGYCYVCESYIKPSELGFDIKFAESESTGGYNVAEVSEINTYDVRGVKERKLKKQYCEMYGMKVSYDQETGEIDTHYYPCYTEGGLTGYFQRKLPKDFKAVGDTKNCKLLGQHLFEGDGEYANRINKKYLIITEGFLDMVAMQQAMSEQGNGQYINAVVSLPNGANVKSVKTNYKFVNSFENVIVALDQDEPGKKAAQDIAKALPMGKVKIASFSAKDPCEMHMKGRDAELSKLIFKAEDYSPAGILDGRGLWETVSKPMEQCTVMYPWDGLNKLTHGIRTSELVTMVAGSGVAKSTFARKIFHHLLMNTEDNIGGMFLEESIRKTGLSLMSFEAKKLLHLPEHNATENEMRNAFDKTLGTGRVFLFDSFGSNDIDTICENIMYFAKAANCKYIFLDHISILVSGGGHGDERRALDEITTKLRTLVQELDITLFMISHLKRPEGKGHENGAETNLSQLRGSAGIGQLSDIVIGIERNGQAEDEKERNTSTLRVLKNRFSGSCGKAAYVHYNPTTGELTEVTEEDVNNPQNEISEFDHIEEY